VANERVSMLTTLQECYREIPVLMLETALPAVADAGNAMLADLSSPDRVRLDCEHSNNTNHNVRDTPHNWVTHREGLEAPSETFSGGEHFLLDIALREAFGELQAARANVDDAPMLVIDEGWGQLDSEHLKPFVDALSKVIESKKFSFVLVVSHVQ